MTRKEREKIIQDMLDQCSLAIELLIGAGDQEQVRLTRRMKEALQTTLDIEAELLAACKATIRDVERAARKNYDICPLCELRNHDDQCAFRLCRAEIAEAEGTAPQSET